MRRWISYSLILFFLVACGGNRPRAPVEDRRVMPLPVPASYSVQRGDTLFSIAWRYGLDYRAVAANNRIAQPYTIYPGQKIYLGQKAPVTTKPRPSPSSSSTSSKPAPASSPTPRVVAKPSPKPSSSSTSGRSTVANTQVSKWLWPSAGRVTRSYSSSVHKGIDIDGRRGDSVNSVAAGKVVYAGTGIVGYGELLIVKHNEIYLSAYGHNNRLLVAEGQLVKAGQKIAEKGSSGTDTVKLHFEIRKEGKPIDPKRLLPAR